MRRVGESCFRCKVAHGMLHAIFAGRARRSDLPNTSICMKQVSWAKGSGCLTEEIGKPRNWAEPVHLRRALAREYDRCVTSTFFDEIGFLCFTSRGFDVIYASRERRQGASARESRVQRWETSARRLGGR